MLGCGCGLGGSLSRTTGSRLSALGRLLERFDGGGLLLRSLTLDILRLASLRLAPLSIPLSVANDWASIASLLRLLRRSPLSILRS